jgi:hypothetical protein
MFGVHSTGRNGGFSHHLPSPGRTHSFCSCNKCNTVLFFSFFHQGEQFDDVIFPRLSPFTSFVLFSALLWWSHRMAPWRASKPVAPRLVHAIGSAVASLFVCWFVCSIICSPPVAHQYFAYFLQSSLFHHYCHTLALVTVTLRPSAEQKKGFRIQCSNSENLVHS